MWVCWVQRSNDEFDKNNLLRRKIREKKFPKNHTEVCICKCLQIYNAISNKHDFPRKIKSSASKSPKRDSNRRLRMITRLYKPRILYLCTARIRILNLRFDFHFDCLLSMFQESTFTVLNYLVNFRMCLKSNKMHCYLMSSLTLNDFFEKIAYATKKAISKQKIRKFQPATKGSSRQHQMLNQQRHQIPL